VSSNHAARLVLTNAGATHTLKDSGTEPEIGFNVCDQYRPDSTADTVNKNPQIARAAYQS
jgi:hypothetical protein